jgi:hypothetical protein
MTVQPDRYVYQPTGATFAAFQALPVGVTPTDDQLERLARLLADVEWCSGEDESFDFAKIDDDRRKVWVNVAPGDWVVREIVDGRYDEPMFFSDARFRSVFKAAP